MNEQKVKSVSYNWRQVGSTIDRDGAGDDCERFTVGEKGVVDIVEHQPGGGMDLWYYGVYMEDGRYYRIFNPNVVEFYPREA
jgi:hypothetical protein